MKITASHSTHRIPLFILLLVMLSGCASPIQPNDPPGTEVMPTLTPAAAAPVTATATATSSTPPPCTETQGQFVKATLPADMLKYPLEVTVYLPPCYAANNSKTYPALYMLHGMTDSNEQWIKLGLTDVADRLISAQTIQPMLIIMPYEVNWQLSPNESGYGKAITDVLIPWVEKTYRVCTERGCRAIGGLSRGGNWAVKLGFEHWQLFTAVGAHSTPLFIGGILDLTSAIRRLPSVSEAPVVYVDAGNKDENLVQVKDFERALTNLHIAHEYHTGSGAHDDAYWSDHVEGYLIWYASHLASGTP